VRRVAGNPCSRTLSLASIIIITIIVKKSIGQNNNFYIFFNLKKYPLYCPIMRVLFRKVTVFTVNTYIGTSV